MNASRQAIVVGVDGSRESKAALKWAIDEARLRGCDVLALYAWALPRSIETFAGRPVYDGDFLHRAAEELLDGAVAESGGGEGVHVSQVVAEGDAADALIDASEDAQLLVVGSRGLGGVASMLLGSVSRRCAHEAACPVVIVRQARPGPAKEQA